MHVAAEGMLWPVILLIPVSLLYCLVVIMCVSDTPDKRAASVKQALQQRRQQKEKVHSHGDKHQHPSS